MTNHVHKKLREHGLSDEEAWAAQVFATLPPEEFEALVVRSLSSEEAIVEAEKILQRLGLL